MESNQTSANKSYAINPRAHITSSTISYQTIILASLCTIICVGGFAGNVSIASIILRRKKMRTATNWFVFNLTISDLAIILLTIPYTMIDPHIDWPFGRVGCKYLVMPIFEHFAGVCVLTHTAVGLARYIIVSNSGRRDIISTSHVKIAICLIWLVAFFSLSVTLMGFLGEFKLQLHGGKLRCKIHWLSSTRRMVYRLCAFVLTYVIPMIATGFSYYRLHKIVSNSLKILGDHLPEEMLLLREKNRREMDSILMKMYIMFAATTLPLQAFLFLLQFKVIKTFAAARLTFDLLLTLFYAQVVTNPLVLFYMGGEYRKEIYQLPVCCCVTAPTKIKRFSLIIRRSIHGTTKPNKERKHNRYSENRPSMKRLGNKNVSSSTVTNYHSNMSTPVIDKRCQSCYIIDLPTNHRNSHFRVSKDIIAKINGQCHREFFLNKQGNATCASSAVNAVTANPANNFGESEMGACNESLDSSPAPFHKFSESISDEWPSIEGITAYYDDGTIMYVYDPVLGCVSLAHDTGRETNI